LGLVNLSHRSTVLSLENETVQGKNENHFPNLHFIYQQGQQ
jgi:hypothetical protein